MKTAILTDSSCNLTNDFIKKYDNLYVVPLEISIDNNTFKDQVNITADEVYESLDHHKVTSSLPTARDMHQKIDEIIGKGYERLLIITISSKLSGTYNAFRLVTEEYDQIEITLFDSRVLGMGLGFIVMRALKLIEEGMEVDNIIKELNKLRFEDMSTVYTIDTLKYLRAGGRIGKVEGTIADILRIKPLISVNDEGAYYTLAKARGNRRALSKIIESLKVKYQNNLINLVVQYGNDIEKAKMLLERLKASLNVQEGSLVKLTPVLGIHTGPGLMAVIAHSA